MENATTERVGRASDPRPEKVAAVDEVRQRLDGTSATILTEYRGLNVTKLADLRNALRAAGGDFKVYKNTLVRFAARDLGLEIEDLLVGPTALAFVTDKPDGSPGDAVDVAKVLKDFGKENPALVVKGGILGQDLLSAADASALADVEPREVLLAKLAGGMAAPMQKFAGLLQALPRNMAYGLKALIDQGGAPGAPADAPAAEPEAEPAAEAEEAPSAEAPSEETTAESSEDTATDTAIDQTEEQATDEAAAENTEEQES
jgi:large subunit ribosomal protein L10